MSQTVSRRAVLVGAALAAGAGPGFAQTDAGGPPARAAPVRSQFSIGPLSVDVIDYSGQFLAWYEAARAAPDPDARFALWQSLYGRAAVPPGPRGEAMARQLVDAAWPRYAEALAAARAGASGMGVDKAAVLQAVARTLDMQAPGRMQLITMIGAFEANAYTYRARPEAPPTLVVPLEISAERLTLLMAHEGAHAIHMLVGNLSGGWERSIGATLIQEGLAMHVAREVLPGRATEFYVSDDPAWWAQVNAARSAILDGVRPDLAASNGEAVMKYTIGPGNAGLPREGYAAGWWVVEDLRAQGLSLAEIARIPEAEMPQRAGAALAP